MGIQEYDSRCSSNLKSARDTSVWISGDRIAYAKFLYAGCGAGGAVLNVDAKHSDSSGLILCGELVEVWSFLLAHWTPCSPKHKHRRATSQVGQRNLGAIHFAQLKIWREVANSHTSLRN